MTMNAITIVSSDDLLSDFTFQQEQFIHEWFANGFNGTQAALAAGYATPTTTASQLLRKPHIKAYVEAKRRERREEMDMALRERHLSPDAILAQLAGIAGFDIGDLLTDGRIDRLKINGERTKALASVETDGGKTKVKTYDKLKALDMIMDHLGMKKTTNTQVNVQINNFAERMAARKARLLEGK